MCMVQLVDPDKPFHRHVSHEYPGYTQGHPEHSRSLCHRAPITAEPENCLAFRAEARKIARLVVGRCHYRLDLELVPGLGPSPSNRIGPDQPAPSGFGPT